MSKAVQGTPRVISEMLLMAGLMKARQVVTPDRTPTAALNLLLKSFGGFFWGEGRGKGEKMFLIPSF